MGMSIFHLKPLLKSKTAVIYLKHVAQLNLELLGHDSAKATKLHITVDLSFEQLFNTILKTSRIKLRT